MIRVPPRGTKNSSMDLSHSRWAPAGDYSRNVISSSAIPGNNTTLSLTLTTQESTNNTGSLDANYDMEDMHLHPENTDDYTCDTAIDDDGDIIMMDLHDPRIIEAVTELTRNQRQADYMSNNSDLKPGLRPIASNSRISQPSCLLIIDTNFIISHLQLVNNLVHSHPRWKNIIVMPWATLQELDGLKKSLHVQSGVNIGKLARSAINWAFGVFAKLDPGVWGQTKEECKDPHLRGDSAILECCRYFGDSYETILLSNDKSLCIQAIVHDIRTVSIIGEKHTAETILARILGNTKNLSYATGTTFGSREPSRPGPRYNLVPDDAPHEYKNPRVPNTHRPTNDTKRCINGLGASIHANANAASPQRSWYHGQSNNASRQPLRMLGLDSGAGGNNCGAQTKMNLNNFLRRVSAELVTTLVPLLKQCVQRKLVDSATPTLEELNCNLEEVRDIIDLERYFHAHWTPVFSGYLPADYGYMFKNRDLSRCWSEWIKWTATFGLESTGPGCMEVRKWIGQWDFVWKRIIFTAEEAQMNIEKVDRWRTSLSDVGLVE